jgi:hypothetical protein
MDNLYLAWWNLAGGPRSRLRRGFGGQAGAIGNIVAAGFTPAGESRRSPSAARRPAFAPPSREALRRGFGGSAARPRWDVEPAARARTSTARRP